MLESIAHWIIYVISTLGYGGIILTMAIESALIPLPSEVIMPFSGYLVSTGQFNIHAVAFAGALGNLIGSLFAYALGFFGKEQVITRFVRKWGKWFLISEEELKKSEELLHKYKDLVVLGSRVVPGIRTVISLPCGFAKLPLIRFMILTFTGSLIWSYFLAWIGLKLGQNWEILGPYFHKADIFIIGAIVLGIGYYIYRKLK
jgi:membrane protein DedA with SNARE-associated domain